MAECGQLGGGLNGRETERWICPKATSVVAPEWSLICWWFGAFPRGSRPGEVSLISQGPLVASVVLI